MLFTHWANQVSRGNNGETQSLARRAGYPTSPRWTSSVNPVKGPDLETTPDQRATSRRALLAALVGAAVATPLLSTRANAEDMPPATTIAPPAQPVGTDKPLLDGLRAVELALVALYRDAQSIAGLSDDEKAIITLFEANHQAYADSLSALLGRDASSPRDPVTYATYAASMKAASFDAVAPTLAAMENGIAKRQTNALASLKGLDRANLLLSISSIEARHGAALLSVSGGALDSIITNTAAPIPARA